MMTPLVLFTCPLTSHHSYDFITTGAQAHADAAGTALGQGRCAGSGLWEGKCLVVLPLGISSGRRCVGGLWKC